MRSTSWYKLLYRLTENTQVVRVNVKFWCAIIRVRYYPRTMQAIVIRQMGTLRK